MAFSLGARALLNLAYSLPESEHAEANEHVDGTSTAQYENVVYIHLIFGCASIVGAMAVYCVYLGLPKGKLDPARCALKRPRNFVLLLHRSRHAAIIFTLYIAAESST
jgi:hypothetical protein